MPNPSSNHKPNPNPNQARVAAALSQHWEHTARGTHSEGPARSPCSAPAAHIAHAAQSCLPRDQCLPPAAGLCKRGRRLSGGRLHPRRRVQHRRHRVRRTAPGQARAPPLPLFPTLTTPAALATPATAATFTSPAPFTTPAASVTATTPLIPDSHQHSCCVPATCGHYHRSTATCLTPATPIVSLVPRLPPTPLASETSLLPRSLRRHSCPDPCCTGWGAGLYSWAPSWAWAAPCSSWPPPSPSPSSHLSRRSALW